MQGCWKESKFKVCFIWFGFCSFIAKKILTFQKINLAKFPKMNTWNATKTVLFFISAIVTPLNAVTIWSKFVIQKTAVIQKKVLIRANKWAETYPPIKHV